MYNMFAHESESAHGFQFQRLIETEEFLKITASVMYTIHVVISQKWCKRRCYLEVICGLLNSNNCDDLE